MTDGVPRPPAHRERMRNVLSWTFAGVSLIFLASAWTLVFYLALAHGLWLEAVAANFGVAVFMPCSCGFALIIVLVLRATAGEIQLDVMGFKLRGASGPIVLWVVCFLAQVFAVKLLWNTPQAWQRTPATSPAAVHAAPSTGTRAAP